MVFFFVPIKIIHQQSFVSVKEIYTIHTWKPSPGRPIHQHLMVKSPSNSGLGFYVPMVHITHPKRGYHLQQIWLFWWSSKSPIVGTSIPPPVTSRWKTQGFWPQLAAWHRGVVARHGHTGHSCPRKGRGGGAFLPPWISPLIHWVLMGTKKHHL